MLDSGYINWFRLNQTWYDTGQGSTFVYAFWLADYTQRGRDHGVGILKPENAHPDWFVHAESAESVVFSVTPGDWVISPNLTDVYDTHDTHDTHLTSRPVLAAVCLGTSDAVYANARRTAYWWCGYDDLIRPGKKLIQRLTDLYLRPPVILTYLNLPPMRPAVPGVAGDSATVTEAPGYYSNG